MLRKAVQFGILNALVGLGLLVVISMFVEGALGRSMDNGHGEYKHLCFRLNVLNWCFLRKDCKNKYSNASGWL